MVKMTSLVALQAIDIVQNMHCELSCFNVFLLESLQMQNCFWFLFAARSYLSFKHFNIICHRFDEGIQQMFGGRFHALKATTERIRLIEHLRSIIVGVPDRRIRWEHLHLVRIKRMTCDSPSASEWPIGSTWSSSARPSTLRTIRM
jgi:hypothetical protein